MARVIPVAMRDAILSGAFHPVVLVQIDWPGGAIRVHSGTGPLSWDGQTWQGMNGFGNVQLPPAGQGIGQEVGALIFGGLPGVVDAALAADTLGRRVDVWFGCLSGRTPSPLLADPVRVFTGTIDDAGDEIDAAAGTQIGQFAIVSGPSQMSGGNPVHSYEDQLALDPGDTAGRWVRAALASAIAEVPKW